MKYSAYVTLFKVYDYTTYVYLELTNETTHVRKTYELGPKKMQAMNADQISLMNYDAKDELDAIKIVSSRYHFAYLAPSEL